MPYRQVSLNLLSTHQTPSKAQIYIYILRVRFFGVYRER